MTLSSVHSGTSIKYNNSQIRGALMVENENKSSQHFQKRKECSK